VPDHGRSRYETNWEMVTTIAECRSRLEESRRMRLASLGVWPDSPRYDNLVEPYPGAGQRNCKGRFIGGLAHDDSHIEQFKDVVRQAKAARAAA
jgi:hypothetical protein